MEDRRTGRTTRALEDCVERARKGETVVYVVPAWAFDEHVERILMAMPGVTRKAQRTYYVWGGGTIKLATIAQVREGRLRGLNAHVEYDHAVWDLMRFRSISVDGTWVK